MIRNASALIERGVNFPVTFPPYLGTTDNITGGRDLHIGGQHGVIRQSVVLTVPSSAVHRL